LLFACLVGRVGLRPDRRQDLLGGLLADPRQLRQYFCGRGSERLERREPAFDQLADRLVADAGERVGERRLGRAGFGGFARFFGCRPLGVSLR